MSTVSDFFSLVQTGGSQNTAKIEALFVPDSAGPPPVPNIGLTTTGPHFTHKKGLDDLFSTLHKTFSSWALDPVQKPPRELTNGNMIAVEAVLKTGHVVSPWKPTHVPATAPLAKIQPSHPTHAKGTTLPVCAVFTMNADGSKIMNLALYFDRWKMGMDLWDQKNPPHIDQ